MQDTKDLLVSPTGKYKYENSKISLRELVLVVMNCKLRPESAAEKYDLWLKAMKDCCGIDGFDECWGDVNRDGQGLEKSPVRLNLDAYAACGRDKKNRSIMWIVTRPVPVEEEKLAISSSVMYFTAIHADMISLREGITFVLDTTNNDMVSRVGNESKLQRTWQSIPLRPQRIYILGANYLKRVLINAAITLASFFTKEKVLERVRFADLDEVKSEIDVESLPIHSGGGGGGIVGQDKLIEWVQMRLKNFPVLPQLY